MELECPKKGSFVIKQRINYHPTGFSGGPVVWTGRLFSPDASSYVAGWLEGDALIIDRAEVLESDRKKGLGRKLVSRLISKTGAKSVFALDIIPEAKGFWAKLGILEYEEGKEEQSKS